MNEELIMWYLKWVAFIILAIIAIALMCGGITAIGGLPMGIGVAMLYKTWGLANKPSNK